MCCYTFTGTLTLRGDVDVVKTERVCGSGCTQTLEVGVLDMSNVNEREDERVACPPLRLQNCSFSKDCASRGLHAHHPRNCLYHLRDWSPARLQLLLQVRSLPIGSRECHSPREPTGNFHRNETCGLLLRGWLVLVFGERKI